MKKKLYIILLIISLSLISFVTLVKWDIDIYMESNPLPPKDKIDLNIIIDDQIVFNDTLKKKLGGYPTHITHPIRIGYHTISVFSKQANIQYEKKVFLCFNNFLLLYYSFDEKNDCPAFFIDRGKGRFGFE